MKNETKLLVVVTTLIFFIGFLFGRYWVVIENFRDHPQMTKHMDETEMENEFVSMKNNMIDQMIPNGDYKCCLENPCTYCLEKSPNHGEGPTCKCLEDIMNGVHPCGECIGEILEGHGNRFIAKYFATAIAEEVGIEHLQTIKEIIASKYNIPVEKQI